MSLTKVTQELIAPVFDSVAALSATTAVDGQLLQTSGYVTANDGGGATYLVKSTGTADGYVNHQLSNGNIAVLQPVDNTVDVRQCGVFADNDYAKIANMFAVLPTQFYVYPDSIAPVLLTGTDTTDPANIYAFSELQDALLASSRINYRKKNVVGESASTANPKIQVKIPAGTHTFNVVYIQYLDLRQVDIVGDGDTTTIVNCDLSGTSTGQWFRFLYSELGQVSGIKFQFPSDTPIIEDPAIVCQPWDVAPSPPWGSATYAVVFHIQGSRIARFFDMTVSGNTTTNFDVRLAIAFNAFGAGTAVELASTVNIIGVRQALNIYNGALVQCSYGTVNATNIYQGVKCHLGFFNARTFNYRGPFNGVTFYAGSMVYKTVMSSIGVQEGNASYYDYKIVANGSVVYDYMVSGTASNLLYKLVDVDPAENTGNYGNVITTLEIDKVLPADMISSNIFIAAVSDEKRAGTVEYVGDGTAARTILNQNMVRRATVTRADGTLSCTTIAGETGKINGANAVFISTAVVNVYTPLNQNGVTYTLVWES